MRIKNFGNEELQKKMDQEAAAAPVRRQAAGLPDPEPYKFDPTSAASMEAAIWDGSDGMSRDNMYAAMDTAYSDPKSPYYNQYRQATNTQYTDPLKKYGLDVPDVITADWISSQWQQYKDYLPTNQTGTNASLPKRHTKEQEIAFSLYQLNAIEYTTQKAEKELDDIRQTVDWYARHGYSQDYIAKVVGQMKHSTLDSIAITRDPSVISQTDDDGYAISTKQGTTVQLNRGIYFDNDILTGMYWKALNDADDVDDFTAAVYAYQNKGKLRGGSKRLDDMRTYGNPNYNPHNDGCTDIEAKMAFGQDEFTYEDLQRLRAETDPFDKTKTTLLNRLFSNEERTANAEKELAWLNKEVSDYDYADAQIPDGKTVQEYFSGVVDRWLKTGVMDPLSGSSDGLSNLRTMDKRRAEGNPMDINRSIDYRREDVINQMVTRYNAAHGVDVNPRQVLAEAMAAPETELETESEVGAEKPSGEQLDAGAPQTQESPAAVSEEEKPGIERIREQRKDERLQPWLDAHPKTDTFDPSTVIRLDDSVPSVRGGGRAAGGAVSDAPMGGVNKPTDRYTVPGSGEVFTSDDVVDILETAFAAGKLTKGEAAMGTAILEAIPWAFSQDNIAKEDGGSVWTDVGNFLTVLGGGTRAIERQEAMATQQGLGEDIRGILTTLESPYATAREKAEATMLLYEANESGSLEGGLNVREYYAAHPDAFRDLQEIADGVAQRRDAAQVDAERLDTKHKIDTAAQNTALLSQLGTDGSQLTEEQRKYADSLILTQSEFDGDTYLGVGVNKEIWSDAYDNAITYFQEKGPEAVLAAMYGDNAPEEGVTFTEMMGMVEQAKYLYAQDAKLAASAGFADLKEYYDTVGYPSVEDVLAGAAKVRAQMNDPANLPEGARQGIGVLSALWSGARLGAAQVAQGDLGFMDDVMDFLGVDSKSALSEFYTSKYGYMEGRSHYRDDATTVLNYWKAEGDKGDQVAMDRYNEYKTRLDKLDASGYDIYYLGLDIGRDELAKARKVVDDYAGDIQEYVDANGTEGERRFVGQTSSAVNSALLLARSQIPNMLTGGAAGALFSTASFFPSSYHDAYTKGKATYGWDKSTSAAYALIKGSIMAASEGAFASSIYNYAGEGLGKIINNASLRAIEKVGVLNTAAAVGKHAGLVRLAQDIGKRALYAATSYAATAAEEILQEESQNVIVDGGFDYVATAIVNGSFKRADARPALEALSVDSLVDTMMSTAMSTGLNWASSQAIGAVQGAPTVFSSDETLRAYAAEELHPEYMVEQREKAKTLSAEVDLVLSEESDLMDAIWGSLDDEGNPSPVAGAATYFAGKKAAEQPGTAAEGNAASALTPESMQEQPGSAIPAEAAESPTETADTSEATTTEPAEIDEDAEFISNARTWFATAEQNLKTAVEDAEKAAADLENAAPEDKASLEAAYQEREARVQDICEDMAVTALQLKRMAVNIDFRKKLLGMIENPELRNYLVNDMAEEMTASDIRAGALVANPEVRKALDAKHEAKQSVDEANAALQSAQQAQQATAQAHTAAAAERRNNPTPETAKREVDAARNKTQADAQVAAAREKLNTAEAEYQKTEQTATDAMDTEANRLRSENGVKAEALVDNLGNALADNQEAADAEARSQVTLPDTSPVQTPSEESLETAPADLVASEAQQAMDEQQAEREAQQPEIAVPADKAPVDINARMSQLVKKNDSLAIPSAKKREALVAAYNSNETVRNAIDAMDDAQFEKMCADIASQGRKLKISSVEAYVLEHYTPNVAAADESSEQPTQDAKARDEQLANIIKVKMEAVNNSRQQVYPTEHAELFAAVQERLTNKLNTLEDAKAAFDTAQKAWANAVKEKADAETRDRLRDLMVVARRQLMAAREDAAEVATDAFTLLKKVDKLDTRVYAGKDPGRTTREHLDMYNKLHAEAKASEDKSAAAKTNAKALEHLTQYDRMLEQIEEDFRKLYNGSKTNLVGENAKRSGKTGKTSDGEFHDYIPDRRRRSFSRRETPSGEPLRSPLETAQKLFSDLGFGLYAPTKRMNGARENATGVAESTTGYAAIRAHSANDSETLFHEIGHLLQHKYGLNTTQNMLDKANKKFLAAYPASVQPQEAFAEFVNAYVNDRDGAIKLYGQKDVTDFEDALRKNGVYDLMAKASLDIGRFNAADPLDRMHAMQSDVNRRNDKPRSREQERTNKIRSIIIDQVDDTYAGDAFDVIVDKNLDLRSNPELKKALGVVENLRSMKKNQARASYMLKNELRTWGGTKLAEGLVPTLGEMSEERLQRLIDYSLAQQALSRMYHAEDKALEAKRKKAIDTLHEAHIRKGIEDRKYELTRGMSREQAEGLSLSPEEIADIRGSVKYAPTLDELDQIDQNVQLTEEEAFEARQSTQVYNEKILSKEELEGIVYDIETNHKETVEDRERLSEWWDKFMTEYAVNSGLITKQEYENLKSIYPYYTPTFRDGKVTRDGVLEKIVGSDLKVMNPMEGFAHIVYQTVEKARNNITLQYIGDALNTESKNWTEFNGEEAPVPNGLGLLVRPVDGPGENTLSYKDKEGNTHYLEFADKELFEVIRDNASPARVGDTLQKIGKITRTISMLLTGSNPKFGIKNAWRDIQQGVIHGSWAVSLADGLYKWAKAAHELRLNSEYAQQYKAMNGDEDYSFGGLAMTQKDADDFIRMFSPKHNLTTKDKAVEAAKKGWHKITLSGINGFIEMNTRFAEYRYGKHDLSTEEGRQRAYLAAQESTTNFSLSGRSKLAAGLRSFISFYNATLQGTWSFARALTPGERKDLPRRIAKTALNNFILGALSVGLIKAFGSDDDKKEYENLADGIKYGYLNIPLPDSFYRSTLRLPISQNPAARAFYALGVNTMDSDDINDFVLSTAGVIGDILGDAIQTEPIFMPVLDVMRNRTHYGSYIIPQYMLDRNGSSTQRYKETTPEMFIKLARFFDNSLGEGWKDKFPFLTEPLALEYMAKQSTGFIGQMVFPFISPSKASGYNLNMISGGAALLDSIIRDFTVDSAYSNDISSTEDNLYSKLSNVVTDITNDGYSDKLNSRLSPEEAQRGVNSISYALGATGPIARNKAKIAELRELQDTYYDTTKYPNLGYFQRQAMARDIEKQINDIKAENILIEQHLYDTYCGGADFVSRVWNGGAHAGMSSAYGYPILSEAEMSGEYQYYNKAVNAYYDKQKEDKKNAYKINPVPKSTVYIPDSNGEDYKVDVNVIDGEAFDLYQRTFLSTFNEVASGITNWDSTDKNDIAVRDKAISKATSAAQKAANAQITQYYLDHPELRPENPGNK